MLKVFIADDEPYVREGIKNIISWDELGFEIGGEGSDGDETYHQIMSLNPDLVLIDIQMPGKLGLQVIKESIENGFKGEFVIISGYSNFEYAKEAINYGVKSYVLKPIDEDELYEIIRELKEEIEAEKNKMEQNKIQSEYLLEYSIGQVILGKPVDESIDFHHFFHFSNYHVALVGTDHEEVENLINLETCIRNRVSPIEEINVCTVKDKVALLFCELTLNQIHNILMGVKHEINKCFSGSFFITLGKEVDQFDNILTSYQSANQLMNLKFLFLEDSILSQMKLMEYTETQGEFDELELLDRIKSYVEIGENNKVKSLLVDLKQVIQQKLYSEEEVKVFITKSCLEFNEKINSDYEITKELTLDNEQIIKEIYNTKCLNALMELLVVRFSELAQKISYNSSDKSIKRIVKYIDKNYYKDLKLEFLAELFNYNSAYLGKVFKSYTKMSFNTYLDTIRINHAKTLLLEDKIKVYQVCERVGYKNIDYFHSKFKKYVGVSPLNYKKQVEGENIKESV